MFYFSDLFRTCTVATVAKTMVKKYDSIIADYVGGLRNVKEQFRDSELRDIQVVVHRLEGYVRDIGMQFALECFPSLNITSRAQREHLETGTAENHRGCWPRSGQDVSEWHTSLCARQDTHMDSWGRTRR